MDRKSILIEEYKSLIAERLFNVKERKYLEKASVIIAISCYAFLARYNEEISSSLSKALISAIPILMAVAMWKRHNLYGDFNFKIDVRLNEIEQNFGSADDTFSAERANVEQINDKNIMRDRYWMMLIAFSMVCATASFLSF